MSTGSAFYQQHYSDQERALANHLIGLEKAALDKWFEGDTSGYAALWSTRSFSYFDAAVTERVDDHQTIKAFLQSIEGKLFANMVIYPADGQDLPQDCQCDLIAAACAFFHARRFSGERRRRQFRRTSGGHCRQATFSAGIH